MSWFFSGNERIRLPVAAKYAHYFEPTIITNAAGELSEHTIEDLMDTRYQPLRLANA